MSERLWKLRKEARQYVTIFLQQQENHTSMRKELEEYVIGRINTRRKFNELLGYYEEVHRTTPIHVLAFFLACKDLESSKHIQVERPQGVPFPMTDWETIFTLKD